MESWRLKEVHSNDKVSALCMQLYFSLTSKGRTPYGWEVDMSLRTEATFGFFNKKIKGISKQYPDEIITVHYGFFFEDNETGPFAVNQVLQYHNGDTKAINTEIEHQFDEPVNDIPC